MSLTSSLYASVAGLKAQSVQLSAISENIANSSTTAYKGRDVHFEALVTNTFGTVSSFTSGSVISNTYQNVAQQGLIENTGGTTEVAINGNGFLVVSDRTNNQPNEHNYSRNGDFDVDADGFLINNEGFYLYGQRTDESGNVLATNSNDLNSVEAVNVQQVTGTASATTSIEVNANLPADLQVEDTPGRFTLSDANAATNYDAGSGNITITVDANPPSVIDLTTIADEAALVTAIDGVAGVTASYNAVTNEIIISTEQGTTSVDIAFDDQTQFGGGLPASATFTSTAPELPINYPYTTTVEVFDSLGVSHSFDVVWTKTISTANDWTATLSDLYLTGDPNKLSTGVIDTGDGDSAIDLVFNGNGTLSYADGDGNAIHDPNGIQLKITGLPASTGANDFLTGTETAISLDLGTIDQTNGLTQFSSNSSVPNIEISLVDQDGVRFGELAGYEIDESGLITAIFDNGLRQTIYQIPVATFPNPGGLTHVNGTVYDENQLAGNLNLRRPGDGSAGSIAPNSLELSTTDTADEFNKMIVAQQAYSAASQVLSTTDEMFETLIQAVR